MARITPAIGVLKVADIPAAAPHASNTLRSAAVVEINWPTSEPNAPPVWITGPSAPNGPPVPIAIAAEIGEDVEVETHIEPAEPEASGQLAEPDLARRIKAALAAAASAQGRLRDIHNVRVRETQGGVFVFFHCRVDPATPVETVHDAVDALERSVREAFSEARRVVGHAGRALGRRRRRVRLGRGDLVQPREEELENRRSVSLVVSDDELDRRRSPAQGAAGHRPGEEIPRISGQEHHGAGRGHRRHGVGQTHHFVRRLDVEAGSLEITGDHGAQGRRAIGRNDERLADDVRQIDGLLRGQAMIAPEYHEQRLRQHTPVG